MAKWALPEYIEDILPPEAERLERLRRSLLDHFHRRGYRLVAPPLLEHLESLNTGTGSDLELQTFKVVDQLSGRLLGLRADITPQVARIDAHMLHHSGITRLCYCGSVVRTLATGLHRTRELIQLGAELYGHAGIESDREVLVMLLSSLRAAGIGPLHLDLGHVGVFRSLARAAGLDPEREDALYGALRSKDIGGISELTGDVVEPWRRSLRELPKLYGPADEVLARTRTTLADEPGVSSALGEIAALARWVWAHSDRLHVDLADLRGYHYHTGIQFAVFTPGEANAIGIGGRYDDIGRAFGRARPATGFTVYLRQLASLVPDPVLPSEILAPDDDDPALAAAIHALRESGETVVVELAPEGRDEPAAVRRLIRGARGWIVEPD
jgi:ATP phosphoribosyltransferase regulatory subunit